MQTDKSHDNAHEDCKSKDRNLSVECFEMMKVCWWAEDRFYLPLALTAKQPHFTLATIYLELVLCAIFTSYIFYHFEKRANIFSQE